MSVLRLARRAMGTEFELILIGADETRLRSAGEAALEEIDRVEEQLSAFLPASEVSYVNAHEGGPVRVSPALFELLGLCERLRGETGGCFDVTVGTITALEGARSHEQKWARAHLADKPRMVLLPGRAVQLRPGAALDLGGIGKGHAVDRAIRVVREHDIECAFLHGGHSTSYALGCPPGERGWPVAQGAGRLFLEDEALSVSRWRPPNEQGVRRRIVDASCGGRAPRPEAWVRCACATEADALSTAFLFADEALVRDCLAARPGADVVFPSARAPVSRRKLLQGAAAAAAAFAVLSTGAKARADEPKKAAPKKPRQPLSIGLVGAGVHGRVLLGQLARMEAVTVPAICDVDERALQAAVRVAGRGVESYQDLEYMLDEESLDALVVATPSHAHADPAVMALAADLHVFVEAPLARSAADAKRIVRAAAKAKRIVHTGHQRRTSRLYPTVSEHAESGALGKLLQLRAGWNRKASWRRAATKKTERTVNWRLYRETSGGLLLEHGSHAFDLGNWLFGCLPEAVTGFGALQRWKDGREVEDSVQVVMRYPRGRQLSYQASLVNAYGGDRELVVGDQASILCMGQHKALLFKEADAVAIGWEQYAKTELLGGRRGIVVDPDATKYVSHEKGDVVGPEADKADYHAALEAFATAVRGEALEHEACDVASGMHAAVMALGAEAALREGKVVTFSSQDFEV